MALLDIFLGISILLFIVLFVLVLVLAFRPPRKPVRIKSTRSDLEKIKAQIE